jgi:GT2 family glycosyltransferase
MGAEHVAGVVATPARDYERPGERMQVSVIVPTHDGHRNLELCIRSLEMYTKNDLQVVVVDSASKSQEMRDLLAEIGEKHTVVYLGENESFSKAINAGIAASTGKYVCFLNDDAFVGDGWDAVMISELSDSRIGMVGAQMPGGAAGLQGASPDLASILRVPFLVFAHVMTRRDVIDKVGLLDAETFRGFGSEDLDYSWRIREAGYKLKVSAARTMHVGGATMNQVSAGGRMTEYGRMHVRLTEKWGAEYVQRESRLYPRVAMCVPTYNGKVDNDFLQSCMMLQKTGNFELELFQTKRLVVHYAREKIVEAVLACDCFDYIWWLDDDMVFPPDTLVRLLAHQKPVVTAIAYQRKEPYAPCIFEWKDLEEHEKQVAKKEVAEVGGYYDHLQNMERTGLRKIDGCGSACVLVDVDVYRKLQDAGKRPWYSNRAFGEDLHFTRLCNLSEPEIKVYADTDLIIGHIGDPVIVDEAHVARWKAHKAQMAGALPAGAYAR